MTHSTPVRDPFPGPTRSSVISISVSTAKQLIEDHLWPEPLYYGSRTIKAARAGWPYIWKAALVAATIYGMYLLYRRRLRRARQKKVEQSYQLFSTQVRFGLDIGGTLCKVVYFEPEITTTQTQAALKTRVGTFIRRSHSYGVTGRRDSDLEVSLNPIRGTLHFLKFQTSMMPNFITIVKENELSPQRPLKAGGGTDQIDEEDESAARRNNNAHHHHHHVHHSQQLLVHPSQMGRSYSAAWRSEDEFRQQFLSHLQPVPQGSATPTGESSSGDHHHIDDLTLDASTATTRDGTPSNSSDSSANSTSIPDSSFSSSTSTVNAIATSLDSASSSATITAVSSTTIESVATIHPRPPVNSTTTATTSSSSSSRTITPTNDQTTSMSCPSSPLKGHASRLSHNNSTPATTSASRNVRASPPFIAQHSTSQPNLNAGEPPKRIIHPSPPTPTPPSVCATGGGAFKFEKLFADELHITLHKEDELRALVKGIDFMIHTCIDECYYLSQYRFRTPIEKTVYPGSSISYPYLVVNIGSGVSILKVTGPSSFERVGGTSLGGGTFYGLCRALTGCTSFEEALQMAEAGRNVTADLLVGDIYGGDYDEIGLAADTVAASFGKLVRGDALKDVRKEDLAKAALVMITNNIGSLANLYARKVLNVPQMIFVGNFLNNNEIAKRGLAFATEYWSKGQAKALFLTHEGYFGAVGSLLGDK